MGKGAEKYGVRNYEKGMPISECIASLSRHLEAYKLGLTDEDHMAAIRTNAGFILHYEEEIKAGRLPASLDDMPHYAQRTNEALQIIREIADPATVIHVNCTPHVRHPFTVYLCGPITGTQVDHEWRERATCLLGVDGIETLDPLRGKDRREISDQGMGYQGEPASVEMADRDRMDVETADLIFAHFPYVPSRQSIGSLMELGIAANMGKPIVLCAPEGTEFNKHLFTRRFCTLEPCFAEALDMVRDYAAVKGAANACSR
jgi:nucleoside 2-deoxyribosyltransferase